MGITKEKTVAEIVTENMGADHVFSKYDIDFCCGGQATFADACKANNLDYKILKKEIETIAQIISSDVNYHEMDIASLISHIQDEHHAYLDQNIPVIGQLAAKVAEVHGENHHEVITVNNLITGFTTNFSKQLATIQKLIYPSIKALFISEENQSKPTTSDRFLLNNLMQKTIEVHQQEGQLFKKIAELTNGHRPPENACNTYKLLYTKLQEFELALHKYIHFEINILFPRVSDHQ